MLKKSHKYRYPIISYAYFLISLVFILVIQGAIPFVSIPTLGQAIWTTGFSQSFANASIFSIHATNFGNPEPAPIAFGLAGAYPASIFIRLGLHAADAYSLMAAFWFSVAFLGAWKISRAFKLSPIFSALASILWLSMPIVWYHGGYSMLSMGIGLLPFYFLAALRIFQCFNDNNHKPIQLVVFYFFVTITAIFMDGYSFIMFAVGSSIIGVFTIIRFPEHRRTILKFSLPIHILSFALACFLYISYIGKTQFVSPPLDFFRGWGIDLMFLAIPSKGVHWLWDTLGVSLARNGHEQFGDASVWASTFALPVIVAGIFAWWRIRKKSKLAAIFLIITLFGFYMGMGPSLKVNSVKPEWVKSPRMSQEYAVAPTGNAWLSEHLPGFKNMRASYRWSAIGFMGLWFLIVLLLSIEQTPLFRRVIVCCIILLIVSNLPNIKNRFNTSCNFRDDFYDIEKSFVEDLGKALHKRETVAFLPYRNDFFVNYLASRTEINSYNIGGDKNLAEARKHWPVTMTKFKMGQIDKNFVPRVILLLTQKEADAVVLPYIDLLWAAHDWPAPLKFKNQIKSIVNELRTNNFIEIDEREFYTVVRLIKVK